MKWKFNNPFLVIALGTALPMMVMLVWALLQTDRVVINQAFALFLPLLPILVTVYLVFNRRSIDPKPGWPRFALIWIGGNALGVNEQRPNNLFQAKIVFAARAITVGSG